MSVVAVIDPSMVAIPNFATDEDEAEEIIKRVREWASHVRRPGPRVVRDEDIVEKLIEVGCYPVKPQLEALLNLFGLANVYSAKDLWSEFVTLLDRATPFDQELKLNLDITGILPEEPDPLRGLSPARLREATGETAAKVVVANVWATNIQAILINGVPVKSATPLKIRATVSLMEGSEAPEYVAGPFGVFGACPMAIDMSTFLAAVDYRRLWAEAGSPEDVHIAIAARALAILYSAGSPNIKGLRPFAIGSEFLMSVRQVGASFGGAPPPVILDTCARIVVGSPKEQISPFKAVGGAQMTRPRDRARASRTHVTKGSEGIRLMMWEAAVFIEFANVGNKWEEQIEVGTPDGLIRCTYT